MTCIAAVVHNRNVYMGADSCVTAGDELLVMRLQKAWNPLPGVVVGAAGDLEFLELLRDVRWPGSFPERCVSSFLRQEIGAAVRTAARECGYDFGMGEDDDDASTVSGDYIIGVHGRLFRASNAGAFVEVREAWAAIGTGGASARAVLYHTRRSKADPRTRLKAALEAAEHYSSSVQRPWVWASTAT